MKNKTKTPKVINTHIGSRITTSVLEDGCGIAILSISQAGFECSQPLDMDEAKSLSTMLKTAIIKAENPTSLNPKKLGGIKMEDL